MESCSWGQRQVPKSHLGDGKGAGGTADVLSVAMCRAFGDRGSWYGARTRPVGEGSLDGQKDLNPRKWEAGLEAWVPAPRRPFLLQIHLAPASLCPPLPGSEHRRPTEEVPQQVFV